MKVGLININLTNDDDDDDGVGEFSILLLIVGNRDGDIVEAENTNRPIDLNQGCGCCKHSQKERLGGKKGDM